MVPGAEIAIDFQYGARQLSRALLGSTVAETRLMQRTRAGIELIRERAAGTRPFMVRMDMPEPHFPCLPPEPYASMYNADDIPPWEISKTTSRANRPGT